MPGMMLELERIDTFRGPAQILRGVSLAVQHGEAVWGATSRACPRTSGRSSASATRRRTPASSPT